MRQNPRFPSYFELLIFSSDITDYPMASNGQLGANQHRVYNDQELARIDAFKAEFLKLPTPAERKEYAREVIFPQVFNYWKSLGMVFTTEEEKIKQDVCLKFNSELKLTVL